MQDLRTIHLMETEELAALIAQGTAALRIVDMRGFVKTQTDEDGFQTAQYLDAREDYLKGHLPGAIYLDWTRDLADTDDPVPSQIASAAKIAHVMGAAGIGDDDLIVAYDASPALQFSTRLWWVLRAYGNANVRVLNGGWAKWTREERAVTTETPEYPVTTFTAVPQPGWRATAEDVLAKLDAPERVLVDARDEGQFSGKIRRGERGGHIPGAVNLPRELFFAPDGTFHALPELAEIATQHGLAPEKEIVAYCNGGVAATSVLFALSLLGYPRLTNYDGSWNEWNLRSELPIQC